MGQQRNGRPSDAKRALTGAVGLLVARGYLDDVPPSRARIEALRLIAIKSEIDFQILLNYTAENIVNSELSHEIQKKEIVRYHKLNK